MRISWLAVAAATLALASASGALASTVEVDTVPGTSNPFLTGYPSGGSVTINGFTDTAPAESPVFVANVTGGETVQFAPVTGTATNGPCCVFVGPNGNLSQLTSSSGGTTVGGYTNFPINALVGVFYDPSAPQGTGTSSTTNLTPAVNQVFYIGNGSLGTFTVPTGATALYLGTVDGYQWSNNLGSFDVTTTLSSPGPVPGEGVFSLALIILMGFTARFRGLIV